MPTTSNRHTLCLAVECIDFFPEVTSVTLYALAVLYAMAKKFFDGLRDMHVAAVGTGLGLGR